MVGVEQEGEGGVQLVDELLREMFRPVVRFAVESRVLHADEIVLDARLDETPKFLGRVAGRASAFLLRLGIDTESPFFELLLHFPHRLVVIVCIVLRFFPLFIAQVCIQLLRRTCPIGIIGLRLYGPPEPLPFSYPCQVMLVAPDIKPCQ